ncbi:thiamine biosynthesis protein ThiF [Corynebacterium propinquum]|uniref:ThiF family adenylyltransferase n=1 Tax=Corynebacterium propinquum TaxID=43769 RepID=UPI000F885CCE|nr:ThiF family adenylyltransferase [Corynebacterium propinquum]RUP80292.1 thiamine biosynthesis protein ThiF [Corynebacterium propinquum]RUP90520.1 thiamine biosynthesis protein ThiF [Corynebacterium propinquum]RUP97100.1 thiamine biosynthesis protein ThiF [Corynebacterium propinquum]WKS49661.1 ThiF family adenylyltransferase [Corynebacterium propinquum]
MATDPAANAYDALAQLPDREIHRTARQMNLPGFGPVQQARLHASHVLIIGAGGLGCPALQQLAAAGVGTITLVDDDTVDLSNIHRQILFGAGDIGKPKVDVAAARARELQPDIQINAVTARVRVDNVVELVGGVDLVLDGSDTFATKYLVADACEILGIPLVWGTVLRYSGEVALWHSGASADGQRQGEQRGVGLRDLFPEQPDAASAPDCATAGVLGVTTSVVAGLMSTEAIAYLAGLRCEPGRVLRYQALPASLTSYRVGADPQRPLTTELAAFYDTSCAVPNTDPADTLLQRVASGAAVALDVREPHEKYVTDLAQRYHPLRLPLSEITSSADIADALGGADEAVVFCASGVRSQRVVDTYAAALPQVQLHSLPGGVGALGAADINTVTNTDINNA